MTEEYLSVKLAFDDSRFKVITKLKYWSVLVGGMMLIALQIILKFGTNKEVMEQIGGLNTAPGGGHEKHLHVLKGLLSNVGGFFLAVVTGILSA